MKNIVLGSIVLAFFALTIALVEVSCQKIIAQPGRETSSSSSSSSGLVLYAKTSVYQINPITHTDSAGNVITDRIDTLYTTDFYTCNVDGSARTKIPITLPTGLDVAGAAKFISNGTAIIFSAGAAPVFANGQYSNGDPSEDGIYTCNLDGSGLKRIVERTDGITGGVNVDDGY